MPECNEADQSLDLSIIIVNYNTRELVLQCLASIYDSPLDLRFEVIVVDNASHDGSATSIEATFPQVVLLASTANLGFGRGNNLGAEKARGHLILFLNPDTIILDDALTELTKFMQSHPEAGAAGGKLLNPDGTLQTSCRRFYTPMAILARRTLLGKIYPFNKSLHKHLMQDWDHNTLREVDWMLAACLIVRRGLGQKTEYFDESFKMYFEDVDLCFRIKQLGYKVYYVPQARIAHHHQRASAKTFNKKTVWHIRSAIRFFAKHRKSLLKELIGKQRA